MANWTQKAEQVHTSTAEMDAREEVRAARETKARARLEAKSKMESRSWAQAQADARARLERQSSEQVRSGHTYSAVERMCMRVRFGVWR